MPSITHEIRNIESLLSDHLKPDTKILKYDTKPLTAPGENYGSIMLAVDVTIEEPNEPPRVLHLVAKRIPTNELLSSLFNVQVTFKKEINMYRHVIPALERFQAKYGKTDRKISELFAKCYGARINLNADSEVVDEDAVLILENLKVPGYDIGDRLVGFDRVHTYKILEDLARFHAVPIAFKLRKPEEFNKHVRPVVNKVKIGGDFPEDMQQKCVQGITEILSKSKVCLPYIDTICNSVLNNLSGDTRMIEPVEPFATIVHTDYWVNNTMILKDPTGKPIGNKIVDLQMPVYNAGVMDLLFFLYSSVQPEVLQGSVDTFLTFYFTCFIECLEEFDVDVSEFSWDNFQGEVKRIAPVELGHLLIMYTPILTKRGAIDDMANFTIDDMNKPADLSENYESRLLNCVLSFIEHKWI